MAYTEIDINAAEVAERIREAAQESVTEEDLRIRVEHILRGEILDRLNIPWAHYEYTLISGVRPDALYSHVIIEYKRPHTLDDPSKREQAVKQIKRYIMDGARGIEARLSKFFGIVLDGFKVMFVRYRPKFKTWDVQGPYDINRYTVLRMLEAIRGLARKPLDASLLIRDFGPQSKVARKVVSTLYKKLLNAKSKKTRTLYEEWKRIFSHVVAYSPEKLKGIEEAYGVKDHVDREKLFFAIHTYYTLVMKLLAAEIVTLYGDSLLWSYLRRLEESYYKSTEVLKVELEDLEEGGIFAKLGIKNFLEADFFAWYLNEWDAEIADAIIEIIRKLSEYEPATAELEPDTIKDLFKELYENLVPQTVRHDLGEYYTPDWLAELILKEIGYNIEQFEELAKQKGIEAPLELRVLDPACGSGTFLVAAIATIKEYAEKHFLDKGLVLEKITQNIVGFDLNPLAVMTARANYLLAIGDLLRYRRKDIEIPVYLADSIFIEKRGTLKGETYVLKTTVGELQVPISMVEKGKLDEALLIFEEHLRLKADVSVVKAKLKSLDLNDNEMSLLGDLYEKLLSLEKEGKDKIWTRVIKNAFAPLLKGKFDYIIGNPPWLSYRYVGSTEYQKSLKHLISDVYELTREAELITQMELGTLFFIRASHIYLKRDGVIGFVMPRSILYADQHKKFREGVILREEKKDEKRVELIPLGFIKVIDLERVRPLFHVPACVVIAIKGMKTKYPISAIIVEAELPRKNMRLEEVKPYMRIVNTRYHLYKLGERSWITEYSEELAALFSGETVKRSYYFDKFFDGATIYPRQFVFVDVVIDPRLGFDPKRPFVKTSERAKATGKAEYRDIVVKGNVEREFLYATLTSTELVPFGHLPPRIVVLPVEPYGNRYRIIKAEEALRRGYTGLASWLNKCEALWRKKRGNKYAKMDLYQQFNYMNKLIRQNPRSRYKVLYPASATYIVSCVVDTESPEIIMISINGHKLKLRGFIADVKTFYYETNDENEAYYLVAILNSRIIDELIKPMQTKGAFGPRDIGKKVLELPIPKYDPSNPIHRRLAELGKEGTVRVKEYLPRILSKYKRRVITPPIIGRIRNEVRKVVNDIIEVIDDLVLELLKDVAKVAKSKNLTEYLRIKEESIRRRLQGNEGNIYS